MYAIYLSPSNQLTKLEITYDDLNNYEGYAPNHNKFNISLFVKENINKNNGEDYLLNEIASKIYNNSPVFGSVYLVVEPDIDSDDENINEDFDNSSLTDLYYIELFEMINNPLLYWNDY